MALPKRRSSHAKVRTRRQQWMRALAGTATVPARTTCAHCGATILPHRYCPNCKRYGELSLGNDKKSTKAEPKGKK